MVTAGAPTAISALGMRALIKVLSVRLRFSEFFVSKKEEMEDEIFASSGAQDHRWTEVSPRTKEIAKIAKIAEIEKAKNLITDEHGSEERQKAAPLA